MGTVRSFFSATLVFIAIGAVRGNAHAQTLLVADCQGITRAVSDAQPGSRNQLKVEVNTPNSAPADGVQVELTNSVTGETMTVTSANGVATFEGLVPGSYTLAVAQEGIRIGTLVIGPMGVSALGGAAVLVGAAAGGGAAVVGAAVVVDEAVNDDSGGDSPSPTPGPTAIPTPAPTRAPVETPVDCNCDPDAEPTPVDDIFQQQVQAQLPPVSPYN